MRRRPSRSGRTPGRGNSGVPAAGTAVLRPAASEAWRARPSPLPRRREQELGPRPRPASGISPRDQDCAPTYRAYACACAIHASSALPRPRPAAAPSRHRPGHGARRRTPASSRPGPRAGTACTGADLAKVGLAKQRPLAGKQVPVAWVGQRPQQTAPWMRRGSGARPLESGTIRWARPCPTGDRGIALRPRRSAAAPSGRGRPPPRGRPRDPSRGSARASCPPARGRR